MNEKQKTKSSKFLSLVLRHQPEVIGLSLDDAGWAEVDDLLAKLEAAGRGLSREQLSELVETNSKQRFVISDCGQRIRANQGHSVKVDLGYQAAQPPAMLYHGTPRQFVDSIKATGLDKRQRHHVHLSADVKTATQVGQRRGAAVVLSVDAAAMAAAGHEFFVTPNGVWLTETVPVDFIQFPQTAELNR